MRKKIFVTKQGGIGDVILATPILSELKKQYPDSYITLMIFSNAYDIVKGLPLSMKYLSTIKRKMVF